MLKLIQTAVVLIGLSSAVLAQQPPAVPTQPGRGARGGQVAAAPRSPEVFPDGRITFHLSAPNATDVRVNGNWDGGRNLAMTKDGSGIWSVTTSALDPELWNYTFSVNGSTMLDPGNYHIVRDGTRYMNSVLVPGTASALYQTGMMPHGTVAAVWYPSTTLKTARRMLVYTPAGYEGSKARYPVLYLFHGGGGDEEAWNVMGAANVILDNLISQGKAKPMMVVMPNANWTESAALDIGGPRATPNARGGGAQPVAPSAPGGGGQNYDRAEKEIIGDIVPFIEKNYRTLAGRQNRAIAGLSMGGGISINVGLKRLDAFASVGQFSSGMFGGTGGSSAAVDFEKLFPGFYKDPAATNKRLRLLYFSCGAADPRMPFQTKAVEDLRNHKIALTVKGFPGAHEWRVWRNSLSDMATMLFR